MRIIIIIIMTIRHSDQDVYIDEDGNYVDAQGNSVFADGGYIDEKGDFIPFELHEDDDGDGDGRSSTSMGGHLESEPSLQAMDEVMSLQDALADLREGFESQILSLQRSVMCRSCFSLSRPPFACSWISFPQSPSPSASISPLSLTSSFPTLFFFPLPSAHLLLSLCVSPPSFLSCPSDHQSLSPVPLLLHCLSFFLSYLHSISALAL